MYEEISFPHRVVEQWNQLPDKIKLSETVNEFKNKYDEFTFPQNIV